MDHYFQEKIWENLQVHVVSGFQTFNLYQYYKLLLVISSKAKCIVLVNFEKLFSEAKKANKLLVRASMYR